jgi:hypothetical protein
MTSSLPCLFLSCPSPSSNPQSDARLAEGIGEMFYVLCAENEKAFERVLVSLQLPILCQDHSDYMTRQRIK